MTNFQNVYQMAKAINFFLKLGKESMWCAKWIKADV